ncbi:MAG: GNAT family N-acetyltransferase [Pseudomonadota bacterium]
MNEDTYLRLVRFDAEAEEIHDLLCVPEVYEYLADGIEPPPSIAVDWVNSSLDDFLAFGGGLWALQSSRCAGALGLVGLSDFDSGSLQLTYLLHPSMWGHGYATRMAATAMAYAFDTGLVTSVWAGADVANGRSIAVLERLGMSIRGHVDYPAGPGVEYAVHADGFDASQHRRLPLWAQYEDDAMLANAGRSGSSYADAVWFVGA